MSKINLRIHLIKSGLVLVFAIGILGCIPAGTKSSTGDFNVIMFKEHYEDYFSKQAGNLQNYEDSSFVIFNKEYLIFKRPIISTSEVFHGNQRTFARTDTLNQYIAYKRGDAFGIKYDTLGAPPRKIPVDSFLVQQTTNGNKLYDNSNDRLFSSRTVGNVDIVTYIPQTRLRRGTSDSIYFYFDKRLKDIPYSLSKELDSLSNSKMYKAVYVYNKKAKDDVLPFDQARREIVMEIRMANISPHKEIDLVLKRFVRERKSFL